MSGPWGLALRGSVDHAPLMASRHELSDPTRIQAVLLAAERLAQRLRYRDAEAARLADCSEAVPTWWRQAIAPAAIFGDSLLSLPVPTELAFSRPVTFLSAAEISVAAGGEYVPLAWLDGGHAIALVHDQGSLPVVLVASGLNGDKPEAEPVADSLVQFLDLLMPQTLCRLVGTGTHMSIELCGERSLLVERYGEVERRDFASDDEIGDYVATFLMDALDEGMRVMFCPASMRPLIQAYAGTMQAALIPPETRAQAAIQRLIADESLDLRENADLEQLIDDAGRFLERNSQEAEPLSRALVKRFADWLSQHPLVDDLYADDDTVERALDVA